MIWAGVASASLGRPVLSLTEHHPCLNIESLFFGDKDFTNFDKTAFTNFDKTAIFFFRVESSVLC